MRKNTEQIRQYEDQIFSKYNENLDMGLVKNRTYLWIKYWFDCHPSVRNDDPDYDAHTKAMKIYNRFTDTDWISFPIARLNAAGIIYIACVHSGRSFTQDEISNEFYTNHVTLRRYYKKIKSVFRL